jgi:hypothetical protein
MTRRQTLGLAFIALGVIVVLAILLYSRSTPDEAAPPVDLPVPSATESPAPPEPASPEQPALEVDGLPPETPPAADIAKMAGQAPLERQAMAFAERYGSYSTQSDYENLEALLELMTPQFASRTRESIALQRSLADGQPEYSGVTTRALKAELLDYSEETETAALSVRTQRRESDGDLYYQGLAIEFAYRGGEWQVTYAEWLADQESAR